MSDARPTINARELCAVLRLLPADKSILIIGPHGVGKSQITADLAKGFGLPLIDRRLSQMMEGDIIGLPKVIDDVTDFLPVAWFKQACLQPAVLLLDELNRASTEILNAAFQIVLDRELNGNRLHPGTRVIACVNHGATYAVNEMDPALINRFAIFNFEPDHADWLDWARANSIDPVLIDFIQHHPTELRFTDLNKMEPLTAYPTPRGWQAVNHCLSKAEMKPFDVCGRTTPNGFFHIVASLVGHPTAISFTKWVTDYNRVVTAEDVLDRYDQMQSIIENLPHDSVVALLDKIGAHCAKHDWTEAQAANLCKFGEKMLTGEDHVLLFSKVTSTKKMDNIQKYHATNLIPILMREVQQSQELTGKKKG